MSCGITGHIKYFEGSIYVDDVEMSIKDITAISWYVGDDLYSLKRKRFFCNRPRINNRTIIEQIEHGVRGLHQNIDSSTVQEMFHISNERVKRNIAFVSAERWKASAAIGYANGKKIFCFPWMNSKDIEHLKEQLHQIVSTLLDAGCIVILPTTKIENIEKVSNNCHFIML